MVRYLAMNVKSDTYDRCKPFALRYRRVNETFYEFIKNKARIRKGRFDS
jgi:hypothetical protein